MALSQDQLKRICNRYGLPINDQMGNAELEEQILTGVPCQLQPRQGWLKSLVEIAMIVVAICAAIVGGWAAYEASESSKAARAANDFASQSTQAAQKSANASERAATATEKSLKASEISSEKADANYRDFLQMLKSELDKDAISRKQQAIIHNILERELSAKLRPLTFKEIESRYEQEVRLKKWGADMEKAGFDSDQIRQALLNLHARGLAFTVYPDGPEKEAAYTVNQATIATDIHRSKPTEDTRLDVIEWVYKENGKHTLEDLRRKIPVERAISDREWAIILTDLLRNNFILLADGKVYAVGRLPTTVGQKKE